MRRLEHQMKETQKRENKPSGENNSFDPNPLHRAMVTTGIDNSEGVLSPPSQHARVAVTPAEKVGELKHAYEDDTNGIATRGKRR